jgi:hypothetical protein
LDSTIALIVSISALLLSIVSPIVTAIINGHYSIKEKELTMRSENVKENNEFYVKHRTEVIESYIASAGAVVYHHNNTSKTDFGKCATEIYLYIDESEWNYIDSINNGIANLCYDETRETLEEFVKIIAKKYSVRVPSKVE